MVSNTRHRRHRGHLRSTVAWAVLLVVVAGCDAGRRLVAVADGVVLDSRTGLEWTSRDHDQPLAWEDADRHCRELVVGERTTWRLPEIGELEALYDERLTNACGDRACHLDPAIRLAGPYVWSASTRGVGSRFYFDFTVATSLSPTITPTLVRRVLCVRRPASPSLPTSERR